MKSDQLSIVIQGPIYKEYSIYESVKKLRKNFNNCQIILSTNDFFEDSENLFDKVIINKDIGTLSPLKFDSRVNNVNRQIKSTRAGIEAADRELILKLRTDQSLESNKILDIWNEILKYSDERDFKKSFERIITISLYSLNPNFNERLPYHISDILLLGLKKDLLRYFSCVYYTENFASWYERNPHAIFSNTIERKFRSKYAVEQWLCLNFLFEEQNFPIAFHNDHNEEIIRNFEDLLVDTFFICHPKDIDLRMPKFQKSYDSEFCNLFCYSTKDIIEMYKKKRNIIIDLNSKYSFPDSIGTRKKLVKIYQWSPYLLKRILNLRRTYQKIKKLLLLFK